MSDELRYDSNCNRNSRGRRLNASPRFSPVGTSNAPSRGSNLSSFSMAACNMGSRRGMSRGFALRYSHPSRWSHHCEELDLTLGSLLTRSTSKGLWGSNIHSPSASTLMWPKCLRDKRQKMSKQVGWNGTAVSSSTILFRLESSLASQKQLYGAPYQTIHHYVNQSMTSWQKFFSTAVSRANSPTKA